MALAKVYDLEGYIMVPVSIEHSDRIARILYDAAAKVENGYEVTADEDAALLRLVADDIDDARTAAGLDS